MKKNEIEETDASTSSGNDMNCGKEALKFLHRTQNAKNIANINLLCVWFVTGSSLELKQFTICKKNSISEHSHRISVKMYETYYGKLTHEAKHQYMINDGSLKNLLFSPLSRKIPSGYPTCSCCFIGMQPQMTIKKVPPKFAIANGFVIG